MPPSWFQREPWLLLPCFALLCFAASSCIPGTWVRREPCSTLTSDRFTKIKTNARLVWIRMKSRLRKQCLRSVTFLFECSVNRLNHPRSNFQQHTLYNSIIIHTAWDHYYLVAIITEYSSTVLLYFLWISQKINTKSTAWSEGTSLQHCDNQHAPNTRIWIQSNVVLTTWKIANTTVESTGQNNSLSAH